MVEHSNYRNAVHSVCSEERNYWREVATKRVWQCAFTDRSRSRRLEYWIGAICQMRWLCRCLNTDPLKQSVAHATRHRHHRSLDRFCPLCFKFYDRYSAAASLHSTIYVRVCVCIRGDRPRPRARLPLWLNMAAAAALNLWIWPIIAMHSSAPLRRSFDRSVAKAAAAWIVDEERGKKSQSVQ